MRQDGPERKRYSNGFLLGLVFLITSLRMLMGTWSLPSSFGEFLNLVLHHITTVYPLVHDYFTEPEGSSLVFVLITIMALFGFMTAIWAAVRFRLWPVFIALLLAITALQTVFYDNPWYLAATFYLIWVVTVFWLLSQKTGKAYAAGSVSLRHSRIGSGRFLLDKGDGADQSLGQAPAE